MHVAQIILVEVEDDDSPTGLAREFCDDAIEAGGAWFDWFGGLGEGLAGRWSGAVIEGDVLKYSDNPERAEEVIAEFMKPRQEAITYAQSVLTDVDVASLSYDTDNQGKYDREGYALHKLGDVLSNSWCPDSGVVDSVDWSADLTYFRDRVKKSPENQYLVVVDFHF